MFFFGFIDSNLLNHLSEESCCICFWRSSIRIRVEGKGRVWSRFTERLQLLNIKLFYSVHDNTFKIHAIESFNRFWKFKVQRVDRPLNFSTSLSNDVTVKIVPSSPTTIISPLKQKSWNW